MTATAHALVAGVLASRFPDPRMAFLFSLTSHYLMDSVPHWDIGTNWRLRPKLTTGIFAITETIAGITVAYLVFAAKVPIAHLFLCIAASLLPDWLETPWYILFARQSTNGPSKSAGILEKLTYRIYKIQNVFHTKAQLPLGLFTQVATVAFFFFLLR